MPSSAVIGVLIQDMNAIVALGYGVCISLKMVPLLLEHSFSSREYRATQAGLLLCVSKVRQGYISYGQWCDGVRPTLSLGFHLDAVPASVRSVSDKLAHSFEVGIDAVVCWLLQEFDVQGYPTLKWFSKDGRAVEYQGGREESDLTTFALDKWQAELPPPEVCFLFTLASERCPDHLHSRRALRRGFWKQHRAQTNFQDKGLLCITAQQY